MKAFERVICVDYSGAAPLAAQRKNIYLADREGGRWRSYPPPGRTREAICAHLLEAVGQAARGRTFIGLDHQFSFPLGLYDALTGTAWTSWDQALRLFATGCDGLPALREDPAINAREWASAANGAIRKRRGLSHGPFWGANFQSQLTRPPFPFAPGFIEQRRLTESWVGAKDIFQIGGNGTVGLQSLCGMLHLAHLREACRARKLPVHFWPFDGWTPPGDRHVVAEIYPALFNRGGKSHEADAMASALAIADVRASRFAAIFPTPSDAKARQRAELEGWIVAVPT